MVRTLSALAEDQVQFSALTWWPQPPETLDPKDVTLSGFYWFLHTCDADILTQAYTLTNK